MRTAALNLGLILATGCSGGGNTPSCPEMPLYDITVPSERSKTEVVRAQRDAIDAGCLTPRGEPAFSNTGGSAAGGSAAGGSASGGSEAGGVTSEELAGASGAAS